MSTSANKKKTGCAWLLMFFLSPLLLFLGKSILEPTVSVRYSDTGKEELKYVWNVQHRIYRGRMQPGGGTWDNGFIFPGEKFFMQFDWWSENGRPHCVSITPRWPRTYIYLDENGNIDTKKAFGTTVDHLDRCRGDWVDP